MLDFNLYYAQTTAKSRRRHLRLDARGENAAKRVFQLPWRSTARNGSSR